MTVAHSPSTYTTTPAQWADDWLTPDEARALRAEDRAAALSRPAPAKPLSALHAPAAHRSRSKLSQVVQRIAQGIAYALIAASIVGLWYIGCLISWALSAH